MSNDPLNNGSNRFTLAAERLSHSSLYDPRQSSAAPYGHYDGRPIIGECTKIHGGIYVGVKPQEAIVIDEKYGELAIAYKNFHERISKRFKDETPSERELLKEVVKFVKDTVVLSFEKFQQIAVKHQLQPDRKIILDVFIREGVGLPRHQVLLACYLLEKLRQGEKIKGFHSIDAEVAFDDLDRDRMVYTTSSGELVTFDPLARISKV